MELSQLEHTVINALEEVKGRDIEIITTSSLTPLFDRVIVASADTNRQTRALARNVTEKVKHAGAEVVSVEGEESGEWILVDLGDIVVHIMQPAIRAHYQLEELWASTPSSRRKVDTTPPSNRS